MAFRENAIYRPAAHVAIVDEVRPSIKRGTTLYLTAVCGRPPRWLIMTSPPPNFDAVVGSRLEIKTDIVLVNDQPWARRKGDYLTLLAKAPLVRGYE